MNNYSMIRAIQEILCWGGILLLFTYNVNSQNYNSTQQSSPIFIDNSVQEKNSFLQNIKEINNDVFHLVTHGKPGQLLIEEEWLEGTKLVNWLIESKLLEDKKHLNIYGCQFAKGQKGKAAVALLEENLGISVAASDDITGIDGDWELEVGVASNSLKINNYKHNLQCPDIPNPTADGPGTNAIYCEEVQLIDYLFGAFIPDQFEIDNPTYQVNWYSDAAGTQLVVADSETFTPSPFVTTTVYAQILDPVIDCKGALVAYTLTVTPPPSFEVTSRFCSADLTTYSVEFSSVGNVTTTSGTITGNQITGIPSGTTLDIAIESNGCEDNLAFGYSPCTCADVDAATVYVLAASCTNGVPDNDGYLQISGVNSGTHYNYIMGSDYSTGDADINNATAIDLAALPIQFGTLPNPTGSQDYTVRIFNGTSDCFKDYTLTLQEQDCVSSCSCDDFIYLNDHINNEVHKFGIDENDGTILTEVGSPWLAGSILSPHGIASDLNGFLYISSTSTNDVFKLNCDGDVINADHIPLGNAYFNSFSIKNTLYATSTSGTIVSYDLCTGTEIGSLCLNDGNNVWGLWLGADGCMYASRRWQLESHAIYKICNWTEQDFIDGTCYNAFIDNTTIKANGSYDDYVVGVTSDEASNIYFIAYGSGVTCIQKYDGSGSFVAEYCDSDPADGGIVSGGGIIYNNGLLYVGGQVQCLAVVDAATLTPLPGGVPQSGDAKAVGILKECCPSPNRQTINQTYCFSGSNDQLFLNDLFPCDGVVCEGQWTPVDAAAAAVYNDCDQSISAGIAPGCYSFTKGSDGLENYPKCGAFELNFNVEILEAPEMTVSADQAVCSGTAPSELSITTTATNIQWQMSTTSCTEGFTDIDGATAATYTPMAISEATYYRAMVTEIATCSGGDCAFESDCITVTIDPDCYDVSLDKTVNQAQVPVDTDVIFTLTVTNNGNAVTGATVTDVLPNGSVYVSDDSAGTFDNATGIWTIGDMANGEVATLNITITLTEGGVFINTASVSINEDDEDPTNNEDTACVSVPVEICEDGSQTITITAETGHASYQWYLDGVAIDGATSETYTTAIPGIYNYTIDGGILGEECTNQMCCPVILVGVECVTCPAPVCIPMTITKTN